MEFLQLPFGEFHHYNNISIYTKHTQKMILRDLEIHSNVIVYKSSSSESHKSVAMSHLSEKKSESFCHGHLLFLQKP